VYLFSAQLFEIRTEAPTLACREQQLMPLT
jgi:hypothetical protein